MRYPKIGVVLWIVQGLLALFFGLASGAPKLLLPLELIPMPIPLAAPFLRSIGVAEVLGALGLILPGVTGIRTGLTPLAAICLGILTICAATYQLAAGQPPNAVYALIVGLLAAFVAYGRLRAAPLARKRSKDGRDARRTPHVGEQRESRVRIANNA